MNEELMKRITALDQQGIRIMITLNGQDAIVSHPHPVTHMPPEYMDFVGELKAWLASKGYRNPLEERGSQP